MKTPTRKIRVTLGQGELMSFIPVPFDPRQVFGKVRAPVKVTLNGFSYRSTIFKMGDDQFIPLRKSNREAAGLSGNETLTVTIALDDAPRTVKLPPDLARALKSQQGLLAKWRALSYTHQREHAEAIETAKKPETRARRVAKAVAQLTAAAGRARTG